MTQHHHDYQVFIFPKTLVGWACRYPPDSGHGLALIKQVERVDLTGPACLVVEKWDTNTRTNYDSSALVRGEGSAKQ